MTATAFDYFNYCNLFAIGQLCYFVQNYSELALNFELVSILAYLMTKTWSFADGLAVKNGTPLFYR